MKLRIELVTGIAILISSCNIYKGSYCTLPNYTGTCIEFLNKEELLYHTETDFGTSQMSYGKYIMEKDTLTIDFVEIPEKYKLKSNEKYEIISFKESKQDSISVEIKLEGSWIANIHYKEVHTDSVFWVSSITSDYELNFKIPKKRLPINLHSTYKKSEVIVPITESGEYHIKITLNEVLGGLSYNHWMTTTSKYLIKKEKRKTYFEQIGNEKWGKYYKYEKKKRL